MINMNRLLVLFLFAFLFNACKTDPVKNDEPKEIPEIVVEVPDFNPDSAYQFIAKQLEFGPRNPGSPGHAACKDWLVAKLGQYCKVEVQSFNAELHTGLDIIGYNIIGRFNPNYKKRIILAAHWDTRFMGEEDTNEEERKKPIPGADDGGSGVGVLLELARLLKENNVKLGVDIIFFDAEDQGKRQDTQNEHTWCLGAQYWSLNPHVPNYRAQYGILLDMVGSVGASFSKEIFQTRIYDDYVQKEVVNLYDKTWKLANKLGYNQYFTNNRILGNLTDDHYYVNKIAKIPMIDIIYRRTGGSGFGPHWHTHDDDLHIIDKNTLESVGEVVSEIIYLEAANVF